MTLRTFDTSSDARLVPHLAEFQSALLDRSSEFLYEKCAVIGDFAVARRIRLDNSAVFEKVVLTAENIGDESKPLGFVLSVERNIVNSVTNVSFFALVRVDLTADEPFEQALGAASDTCSDRMNRAIVALLELQARDLSSPGL